jgi:RimJ/RimL family protein N-acetyltransferase
LGFLLKRAEEILQTEGLLPLLRRGLIFLMGYIFRYERYYLYEHTMKPRDEAEFLPKTQDFTFEIVSTTRQADELAAAGFDFGTRYPNARGDLDKGAVAFCFFINGELAHFGQVAMNEEAKKCFDVLPYRVDFSGKQACTGGTWTHPKYRGMGLMGYVYFKKLQFLREMGMIAVRTVVAANNVAVQQLYNKLGAGRYAEARYLKFLWWDSWKETPLS